MNTHLQKLNASLNHAGCRKDYKPAKKNYENKFLVLIGTDKLFRKRLQMLNIGIKETIHQTYSRSEFELG